MVLTVAGGRLDHQADTGIAGLTGFVDPLDLVEDVATATSTSSSTAAGRITLAQPVDDSGPGPETQPVITAAAGTPDRPRGHVRHVRGRTPRATVCSTSGSANGVDIPGATGSSYTLDEVRPADHGAQFQVVVSNTIGTDDRARPSR